MMDYYGALAYGRRVGCRFYVYNSNGGLLGGFKERKDAERCKAEWEARFRTDPWNKDLKVEIKEVARA